MIGFVRSQVFPQSINVCVCIYIYVCTLYMYVHVYILDELDALLGQHNLSFSIDREVKRGSTSCSTTTATAQRIGLKATCI